MPPVSYGWPASVHAAALPPSAHPRYATPPAAPPQYAAPAPVSQTVNCAYRTLRVHGLSRPEGIAVDAAGSVFIADWGNDRIIAVTTGTAPTTLRVPGLDGPAGVALGDGTLYVTDSGNNRVQKFTHLESLCRWAWRVRIKRKPRRRSRSSQSTAALVDPCGDLLATISHPFLSSLPRRNSRANNGIGSSASVTWRHIR